MLESAEKTQALSELMTVIEPHLINISYLKFNQRDYIYRFRNTKERNTQVYQESAWLFIKVSYVLRLNPFGV